MVIQAEQLVEQRKRKRQPEYTLTYRSLYRADGTVKLKLSRELSQIDISTENMLGLTEISVAATIHRASNKAQRSLVRPIDPQYLSHIESLEEFRYIFLQLVRCHRVVHVKTGSVHGDLNLNNLVFMRDEGGTPSSRLNDWDAAKLVPADETYRMPTTRRCAGTAPFMAIDLLCEDPPPHLYRHGLESFLYVLTWCAIHLNLNGSEASCIKKVLEGWMHGTWDAVGSHKEKLFASKATEYRKSIYLAITPEFRPIQRWIQALIYMFDDSRQAQKGRMEKLERLEFEGKVESPDAWDEDTLNGTVTYEKFMAAIGEDPCITSSTVRPRKHDSPLLNSVRHDLL
ncbi:hypothetical protein EWM64_g4740 [Hericium alpestre]|uniref:Fungal-type protein kinase domain-containing protein n=1 Tax=Hericium alpestre TaxID=135208 RepID=A0A4Y9ZYV9_9AGAM|nr:hypothetical protein EWM64_g4740 [Hericium alpestre]